MLNLCPSLVVSNTSAELLPTISGKDLSSSLSWLYPRHPPSYEATFAASGYSWKQGWDPVQDWDRWDVSFWAPIAVNRDGVNGDRKGMQMNHKADETLLWRKGSKHEAGCDPVAAARVSGAIWHNPWSPAWLPSVTPEGRSLQCVIPAKSVWMPPTRQQGTKCVSLGNWTTHLSEIS